MDNPQLNAESTGKPIRVYVGYGLLLTAVAVLLLSHSWQRWGDPLIDLGRDLYIAGALVDGVRRARRAEAAARAEPDARLLGRRPRLRPAAADLGARADDAEQARVDVGGDGRGSRRARGGRRGSEARLREDEVGDVLAAGCVMSRYLFT